MRINQTKNAPEFSGLYNNKLALKTLEKISDHSASFVLGASFISAVALKPLAISVAPKVDKENKKAFSAESIASATVRLGLGLAISLPIESAVKNINENPKSYFKEVPKNLDFISQAIKMGTNLVSAIPKSLLTVALIPFALNLFKDKKEEIKKDTNLNQKTLYNPNFTSFKGNFAKSVASLMESDKLQKFANENLKNKKNLTRNMTVVTDVLLATTSSLSTINSKKIEEKRKKPLVLNKLFSTGASILAGCTIDKIVQNLGEGFVEKFKNANLDNPKLLKYIEGLNVLRPTVIFALIYYGLIPIVSAYATQKIIEKEEKVS